MNMNNDAAKLYGTWTFNTLTLAVTFGISLVGIGWLIVNMEPQFMLSILAGVVVAGITFFNPAKGVYFLIFSLLLSPEIQVAHVPGLSAISLGWLVGLCGLLIQATTTNTFIIVRIMEPFWFLTAIVMSLWKIDVSRSIN